MSASPIAHIHMFTVTVSDQDAALAFWTQKLGFEVRADLPYGKGERWVEVAPPGAQTVLALVPPMESVGTKPGVRTNVGFQASDIDATHALLSERGVEVEEVMRMGDPVPPLFSFRDNDGNQFMIAESAEG